MVGALTDFINLLLRGDCPKKVRPILFAGNMIALNKDKAGLRPIAVGYIWRRLAAKYANRYAVARHPGTLCAIAIGHRSTWWMRGSGPHHKAIHRLNASRPGVGEAGFRQCLQYAETRCHAGGGSRLNLTAASAVNWWARMATTALCAGKPKDERCATTP